MDWSFDWHFHVQQIYRYHEGVSRKIRSFRNRTTKMIDDELTGELSKVLPDVSLWREANTRRPTLPPSALTFDVKTAAARKTRRKIDHFRGDLSLVRS